MRAETKDGLLGVAFFVALGNASINSTEDGKIIAWVLGIIFAVRCIQPTWFRRTTPLYLVEQTPPSVPAPVAKTAPVEHPAVQANPVVTQPKKREIEWGGLIISAIFILPTLFFVGHLIWEHWLGIVVTVGIIAAVLAYGSTDDTDRYNGR
jgi:hypothetical protein